MKKLILVSNPGSASRKYALFHQNKQLAAVHVEHADDQLIATLHATDTPSKKLPIRFKKISDAASHILDLLREGGVLSESDDIVAIGLRIVAPSAFFMKDHRIDDKIIQRLEEMSELAPIHIKASLEELKKLRKALPSIPVIGVSDSAFHATKPSYAWNYGINLEDADRFDIKRFGYHGLSVSSTVETLWKSGKLTPRVVVCHLGSGSSVTAVYHRRSLDTTMGYTPLEGVVMASRSGSIDPSAVRVLKQKLGLDDSGIDEYLHANGGLQGLGGSSDIRELIKREAADDNKAKLALATLVHSIHKSIGQMIVALGGVDCIVFTGTVGERSAVLRKRIIAHLQFADFALDSKANTACTAPESALLISQKATSKPIFVIPTAESREIAHRVATFIHES